MSLPPELGAIDRAWSQDEQPTIARPSRIPTAPARQVIPSEAPTAPGLQLEAPTFELDLSEPDAEVQERVTRVPEMPLDDFARRAMMSDSAAARASGAPIPRGFSQRRPDSDSETPTEVPTDMPTAELPTAPPGPELSFSSRRELRFPPASNPGVSLDGMDSEMTAPRLSEPRKDPRAFQGIFNSVSPGPKAAAEKMKERFAMGDFSGALLMAERILRERPRDNEATAFAKRCRDVLVDMFSSRLSGLHRVPRIVMGADQIRWLSLDHRAGFLLSMIDGISSIDDLLDVSGMQRVDALRILCDLLDQKVISLD